ncbi:MAG: methylenetetrahydrofolate--tRNA-(uracil(54)-C(5))-methyltransferase (FADH(2)-oxidizing) TrmFO [Thermodesulfobacteriota bacterium]
MSKRSVTIIGGGLAGCEAAWQLSRSGVAVLLYEMKPTIYSPAHKSENLGELVCSNSLKSGFLENASGLLKEEMKELDSLMIEAAYATRVPAGSAIAVDRDEFSTYITKRLEERNNVEIVREECKTIPSGSPVIIATGPLTSESLSCELSSLIGEEFLYFYDAISPTLYSESIDFDIAFKASRYAKGGDDYINCPMNKEGYYALIDELLNAEKVKLKGFEKEAYFEGCMPVEVIAERGRETLAYGPMKPVGLINPKTGKQAYAVVQLRRENSSGTLYGMVGFQTKLTYPEQKRIFSMIPGLEKVEFARYGSLHRNTYINSPEVLKSTLQLRSDQFVYIAGQLTGVEGYCESGAMGIVAGINAAHFVKDLEPTIPPPSTMIGALIDYITCSDKKEFQPMNANFGILPSPNVKGGKKVRRMAMVEKAISDIREWREKISL